ncbi:unnamed protein product [Nezara viridula]|uniref:Uncharacterized protein n=1 Tax=Nezara viridula TaxID=85310 RepID=A0A9P0GVK4_NEZVI|nr:unnamed protein product [Nezara viridula]
MTLTPEKAARQLPKWKSSKDRLIHIFSFMIAPESKRSYRERPGGDRGREETSRAGELTDTGPFSLCWLCAMG